MVFYILCLVLCTSSIATEISQDLILSSVTQMALITSLETLTTSKSLESGKIFLVKII